MALVLAIVALGVALAILFVGVARERGPAAQDAAVAYEHAWHRRDFSVLFDLSDSVLRDGLDRAAFVAAKREALGRRNGPNGTVDISVEAVDGKGAACRVVTRVASDGDVLRNELRLVCRHRRWWVTGYALCVEHTS